MRKTWRPFYDALALIPIKLIPPKPNNVQEHTGDATTLPTHPKEENGDPGNTQDTDEIQSINQTSFILIALAQR
jgi:hypothetical protein